MLQNFGKVTREDKNYHIVPYFSTVVRQVAKSFYEQSFHYNGLSC